MDLNKKSTQINNSNTLETLDCVSRQAAIDAVKERYYKYGRFAKIEELVWSIEKLPSAQPDYTEMKQEFLRMASYIDVLLECSDKQKETLIGFISRLAEFMPWTERD